ALLLGSLLHPVDQRVRLLVIASLALFATPIFIFTNLHIEHDYYQSACALFLIAALAISTSIWQPRVIPIRQAVPLLTALLVASNLISFFYSYYGSVTRQFKADQTRALAIGQFVRNNTPPDSAIVVFGNDWSSDIAYYSERKSLT